MDLAKYIGSVPSGEYSVRVTKVEAGKSKAGEDMLTFTGHFDLGDSSVDQQWRYPLTANMLWKLRQDLEAAEVLREGDTYSDDVNAFAQEVQDDLSDRFVTVSVEPQRNNPQYMNFRITGVSLSA